MMSFALPRLMMRPALTLGLSALLLLLCGASMAQDSPVASSQPKKAAMKLRKIKPKPAPSQSLKQLAVMGKPDKATADKLATARRDFRWEGEELYYAVEISGADAARASVRVGQRQSAKGVTYVSVAADAVSHGVFAKTYPVNNRADTFIDVHSFHPLKADKVIREDGNERVYKVRYQPGAFTARVDKDIKNKDKKKEKRTYDRAVPGDIHDGLSWLFELRSEPLKQGDTHVYYIYDGWKLSRLTAKVVGREKAWTPLQEYNTIKVDVEREVLNSSWTGSKKRRGAPKLSQREKPYYFSTVYLSDDEARIPVKIFATSKKADSELKLVKYKAPGK